MRRNLLVQRDSRNSHKWVVTDQGARSKKTIFWKLGLRTARGGNKPCRYERTWTTAPNKECSLKLLNSNQISEMNTNILRVKTYTQDQNNNL